MMLFGFLFLDILLWAIFPLVLMVLLWADKKVWAGGMTLLVIAALVIFDWTGVVAAVTNPVWIGNAIKNVLLYASAGFLFSFLKWKVLASKTARAFEQYIGTKKFGVDESKESNPAAALKKQRDDAADYWNKGYLSGADNKYREVLQVIAKEGSGWTTKYNKFVLGQYVTSWVVYWPFYAILLVIDDLIRHIIDWFVEVFGKGYQKLADASFSHIE